MFFCSIYRTCALYIFLSTNMYTHVMEKDFGGWNERKKLLQARTIPQFVHEREIWWCSFGMNIGDEEDRKNNLFERPALVIRKFNRSVVLVAPLTTKAKSSPYYFCFTHDNTTFAVILSQLRLVSTRRLNRRIRKINSTLFSEIKKKIIDVVITP